MKYKTVFLDFYGTLAFGDPSYAQQLETVIAKHGKHPATMHELNAISNWYALCDSANGENFKTEWDLLQDYLDVVWNHFEVDYDKETFGHNLFGAEAKATPYPEVEDFLNAIAKLGLKTCIVSNADNRFLHAAIEHNAWTFDFVISSEDCRSYKPHSTIFETALTATACEPEEVIHIGDSWQCDIRGASGLNIDSLWINRHNHPIPEANPRTREVHLLDPEHILTI